MYIQREVNIIISLIQVNRLYGIDEGQDRVTQCLHVRVTRVYTSNLTAKPLSLCAMESNTLKPYYNVKQTI